MGQRRKGNAPLPHRVFVTFTDREAEWIAREAERTGTSRSSVVRLWFLRGLEADGLIRGGPVTP